MLAPQSSFPGHLASMPVIGHSAFSPFTLIKPNQSPSSANANEAASSASGGGNTSVNNPTMNGFQLLNLVSLANGQAQSGGTMTSTPITAFTQSAPSMSLAPVSGQPQWQHPMNPAYTFPFLSTMISYGQSLSPAQPQSSVSGMVAPATVAVSAIVETTAKLEPKHKDRENDSHSSRDNHSTASSGSSVGDLSTALVQLLHDDSDNKHTDVDALVQENDATLTELINLATERFAAGANKSQPSATIDVSVCKSMLAYVFQAMNNHDSEVFGCLHCHEKKGSRWTDRDDRAMIDLLTQGHDFTEIAKKLKRTVRALKDRYCYLKKAHLIDAKSIVSVSTPDSNRARQSERSNKRKRRSPDRSVDSDSSDDSSYDSHQHSEEHQQPMAIDSTSGHASHEAVVAPVIVSVSSSASAGSETNQLNSQSPSPQPHSPSHSTASTASTVDDLQNSSQSLSPQSQAVSVWSPSEEEQVFSLLRSGASLRECSAICGRSIAAIKGKMQRTKSRFRAQSSLVSGPAVVDASAAMMTPFAPAATATVAH